MNPFLWSGPSFLGFYFFLVVAVLAWCAIRARLGGASVRLSQADLTSDPYRIAYLRGGEKEAIRIAVFNLVDRGLIAFDGAMLKKGASGGADAVRRPLDRAIIAACKSICTPVDVLKHPQVRQACAAYNAELIQRGLLPDNAENAVRLRRTLIAAGILGGVAIVKIAIAISSGRWNIGFLIVAAIFSCLCAVAACNPRVTNGGRQALSTMRTLVKRLKSNAERLKPGGSTNEALLLASVLGLYALPGAYAFAQDLYPKPKPSSSDGSSGSDSSSCSSSCGGGGGCGGCGGG